MPEPQSLLAKLPPKQRKFVREYLKDQNQTQAYIRAGYSETGAAQNAAILIRKHKVASAIEVSRAKTEIAIAQKTVADMLELEEHFTAQLRGEEYKSRILDMEAQIADKRASAARLADALKDPSLDPSAKAMMSLEVLKASQSILDDMATIAQIHIAGRNESNKAGVTLLKVKGAFDPKRPPMSDPIAVLNDVARAIMRANVEPSAIMQTMRVQAKNAEFSIRAGDVEDDGGAPGSGADSAGGRALFSRALSERETP